MVAKKKKKPQDVKPRTLASRRLRVGTWAPIRAAVAAKGAARDDMVLELRWQGGKAMVASVIDNDQEVDFNSVPSGASGVRLSWSSEAADAHFLQWDLLFSGERTNLGATATMNGQGGFDEPVGKASRKNGWTDQGRVIPEGGE